MTAPQIESISVVVVLVFLAVLVLARQVIVARSGAIRATLGMDRPAAAILCGTHQLGRGQRLSVFEINGQTVVVLQGTRGGASMLHLGPAVAPQPLRHGEARDA